MQKVLVTIKTMIKNVMKKEPVLSIAVILAVISMFVVHPDDTYVSYIDFRTLAILFLSDGDCCRNKRDRCI